MRLPDEYEERGMGTPVIYTIVAVSAFILIILAVVFASNNGKKNSGNGVSGAVKMSPSPSPTEDVTFAEGQEDIEALYKEHKLRAEDLDFWDMYQNNDVVVEAVPTQSPSPEPSHEPTEEEMATDGKHVKITHKDGEEEWVNISDEIALSTYDFTNLKISGGKMAYYQDGEKKSWLGVDLSEDSGEVDFQVLKDSGIDFVMIRLGSRGYESGLISLDEKFVSNITAAQAAGLHVGVSFFSQAVNVKEAVEEAEFVASNLIPYQIDYPVAFDMEYIVNDEARIDSLNVDEKTQIAEAFLSTIEKEGYRPILYGNTDWLLGELVPDKLLSEYDIWLNDQSPVPEYPYQFKLWRYATQQQVSGVEKETSYTISFVDYTRK
ncbi:MAG: GH25 family lysozyme [Firmicutes bacterium]|nr:GH25 family lysozyme [Bacillota bacterium]